MEMQLPTPLSFVSHHAGHAADIRLYIKRDDLIHPVVQGNKWRKIHLLFDRLRTANTPGIITFGGAFSNYLHAVAYAAPLYGLAGVAIVRGTAADPDNHTLRDVQAHGMTIFPVPKKEYDQKEQSPVIQEIIRQFPGYAVVPEGGATREGVLGCAAIAAEIKSQITGSGAPLFIAVPAGTGCTAAGIIAGMAGEGHVLVFPAAAYGVSGDTIGGMMEDAHFPAYSNFTFFTDYIRGKFAAPAAEIRHFADDFYQKNAILPDPIYTSRMLFGIDDLLKKGYLPADSTVVAVHTGGLQGGRGTGGLSL